MLQNLGCHRLRGNLRHNNSISQYSLNRNAIKQSRPRHWKSVHVCTKDISGISNTLHSKVVGANQSSNCLEERWPGRLPNIAWGIGSSTEDDGQWLARKVVDDIILGGQAQICASENGREREGGCEREGNEGQ